MQITTPLFNLAPTANAKAASAKPARSDAASPAADTTSPDSNFARLLQGRQKPAAPVTSGTPVKIGAASGGSVYHDPRPSSGPAKSGPGLMQGTGPVRDPIPVPVSDDPADPLTPDSAALRTKAAARADRAPRLPVQDDKTQVKTDPLVADPLGKKMAPIEEPEDESVPDQPIKAPPGAYWPGPQAPVSLPDPAAVAGPVRAESASDPSKTTTARSDRLAVGLTNGPGTPPASTTPSSGLPGLPGLPVDGRGPVQSQPGDSEPISLTPDTGEDAPALPTMATAPGKRPLYDTPGDLTAPLEGAPTSPMVASPESGSTPRTQRGEDARRSSGVDVGPKPDFASAASADEIRGNESRSGPQSAEGRSFADTLSAIGAPVIDATTRSNDPGAAPVQATIDTPATSPEFREALGVQVSLLVADGVQTAELHLNPADMGPISVQIVTDGTQAQVDFGADLAATRHIIESGLPELASALRDAGITLTGGGVSSGSSNGQANDGTGARGTSRRITIDGGDMGTAPIVRSPTPGPRGTVDLYA